VGGIYQIKTHAFFKKISDWHTLETNHLAMDPPFIPQPVKVEQKPARERILNPAHELVQDDRFPAFNEAM
jgi:hypothetical protein